VNANASVADDEFIQQGFEMLSNNATGGIAQFFDRDWPAEMASIGMEGLQEFMVFPDNLDDILERLEARVSASTSNRHWPVAPPGFPSGGVHGLKTLTSIPPDPCASSCISACTRPPPPRSRRCAGTMRRGCCEHGVHWRVHEGIPRASRSCMVAAARRGGRFRIRGRGARGGRPRRPDLQRGTRLRASGPAEGAASRPRRAKPV
jgi:hypothetical protein